MEGGSPGTNPAPRPGFRCARLEEHGVADPDPTPKAVPDRGSAPSFAESRVDEEATGALQSTAQEDDRG